MNNQLPLATLIELAQHKTDDATRRLGELQQAQHDAAEKLALLKQYRQEYLDQMQTQLRDGVDCARLHNLQQFIGTLDDVIEQQTAISAQADTLLAHGRGDWQHCKRRLSAFDTLSDRVRQQEVKTNNKNEQRDLDERSTRKFQVRSNRAAG